MSRISAPEDLEGVSRRLFSLFVQKKPSDVSDDDYYEVLKSFFRTIITLHKYHECWKKEDDIELFDILTVLITKSMEVSYGQRQLKSIFAWFYDKRFMMLLALLENWNSAPATRIQLDKLIHSKYDLPVTPYGALDDMQVHPLLGILQRRFARFFLEHGYLSDDLFGILIAKNELPDSQIQSVFSEVQFNVTNSNEFLKYLKEHNLSVLAVTQHDLLPFKLNKEIKFVKRAHECMSAFLEEYISDPCCRASSFIMTAYQQLGDEFEENNDASKRIIYDILWRTEFSGVLNITSTDEFSWIKQFLHEVLSTLYFIVIPGELPKLVLDELCITFAGADTNAFNDRMQEFKRDPFFSYLLNSLLVLTPSEKVADFDQVIEHLAHNVMRQAYRKDSKDEPASISYSDLTVSDIPGKIHSWKGSSKLQRHSIESFEALTVIAHQCIDLKNLAFCELKKEEIEENLRQEAESHQVLNPTRAFELKQKAWGISRNTYCLRKQSDLYKVGEAMTSLSALAEKEASAKEVVKPLQEYYEAAQREIIETQYNEKKLKELSKVQADRDRERQLQQEDLNRVQRLRQEGAESYKQAVYSRLKTIGFVALVVVGIALLAYLSVQTGGLVPVIFGGIGAYVAWGGGGIASGVGILRLIHQYARKHNWFSKKTSFTFSEVSRPHVPQAVSVESQSRVHRARSLPASSAPGVKLTDIERSRSERRPFKAPETNTSLKGSIRRALFSPTPIYRQASDSEAVKEREALVAQGVTDTDEDDALQFSH